jgi:hypothetical protein
MGGGIERDVGILIVDLPTQDPRIVTGPQGQLFGDFARQFAIFCIGTVELRPVSMFRRWPSSSTRSVSGYFCVSHAGGAAVGVPITL